MSLTSFLKDNRSPISKFFKTYCPNTKRLLSDARRQIRKSDIILPNEDVQWSTIGTAIDYRIRYYFGVTPNHELVAHRGAQLLSRDEDGKFDFSLRPEHVAFFCSLDDFLTANSPAGTKLSEPVEDELNRYCVVLALMEVIFRAGPMRDTTRWDDYPDAESLLSIPPPHWIDDMRELSWKFYDDHSSLFSLPCILNPNFDGSHDVGGADADLLVDGTLIDVKTTKQNAIDPKWIWQLLGYVLLDYSERHQIRSIGLYMARHGILFKWDIEDAIEMLCGCPSKSGCSCLDIETLRVIFRAVAQGSLDACDIIDVVAITDDYPNVAAWASVWV